jgi:hypothetical protein
MLALNINLKYWDNRLFFVICVQNMGDIISIMLEILTTSKQQNYLENSTLF